MCVRIQQNYSKAYFELRFHLGNILSTVETASTQFAKFKNINASGQPSKLPSMVCDRQSCAIYADALLPTY